MSYVYAYMTEAERMDAYEVAKFENAMMKIEAMFERAETEHRIRLHNIDTELYVRECAMDELSDVYANEMALYTEGVKELWDKFIAKLTEIITKIGEKLGLIKKKPEAQGIPVEIPFGIDRVKEILKEATKSLTEFIKTPAGQLTTHLSAAAAGTGIFAGLSAALKKLTDKDEKNKTPKKKFGEYVAAIFDIKSYMETVTKLLVQAKEKIAADKNADGDPTVFAQLRSFLGGIGAQILGLVNKVTGKSKGSEESSEGEGTTEGSASSEPDGFADLKPEAQKAYNTFIQRHNVVTDAGKKRLIDQLKDKGQGGFGDPAFKKDMSKIERDNGNEAYNEFVEDDIDDADIVAESVSTESAEDELMAFINSL